MERQNWRIIFAILLIAMGVVFLLSTLNLLPFQIDNNRVFWLIAFGVGGLAFLSAFMSNLRDNWWAAIPGFTLLGLAGLTGLPALANIFGGAFFLGMIGLSFWVIFLVHREFWWAVIPGGVLLTLAGVTLLGDMNGLLSGAVFFLGLALTFVIVYLLPTPQGRMRWAIWPAGVLGVIGALTLTGAGGAAAYIWPALLIFIGGLLVYRAMRPKEKF